MRTGIACVSMEAGAPCGDSHLTCMLDDERLLVLICDGMGSGEAACRESAVAVRLLGRFLRAGAGCGLAIETVNALLLNRGGEEMFATVDMLIFNLNTGEAELVKLAACPSLILRDYAEHAGGLRCPGRPEQVQPGVQHAATARRCAADGQRRRDGRCRGGSAGPADAQGREGHAPAGAADVVCR